MLNSFRKLSGSLPAKALLILVALTFVLWGVGDVLKGKGTNVIVVGEKKISDMEWRNYFQNSLANFEKMSGQKITAQQIKEEKIVELMAEQLIGGLLMQEEARTAGILVSDDMIAARMAKIPEFQTEGKFDKDKFVNLLKENGLSEKIFVDNMKNQVAQELLLTPFSVGVTLPKSFKEQLILAQNIEHQATVVKIDAKNIPFDQKASDEDLKEIYELNKHSYAIKDKRDVSYVAFDVKDLKVKKEPTDEALQELYNERLEYFNEPEKRLVDSMMFQKIEDAQAAHKEIAEGADFNTVARKHFPDKKDFSIGYVSRDGFDKDTIAAIFNTTEGNVSAVTSTPLGHAIFKVIKLQESHTKPFAEVKEALKVDFINEQKFEELNAITADIEKLLNESGRIMELASKHKFTLEKLEGVSEDSKHGVMSDANFSQVAFKEPVNKMSQIIPFAGKPDKFFVLQVDSSMGQGFTPFEKVKDELTRKWELVQKRKIFAKKMDEAISANELTDLKSFSEIFKGDVSAVKLDFHVKNNQYPEPLVADIYKVKVGKLTDVYGDEKNESIMYFAKLNALKLVNNNNQEMLKKAVEENLPRVLANEYAQSYVENLKKKHKINFAKELAEKIVGIE